MTLKLNHPCSICKKELILGDSLTYSKNGVYSHTECLFNEKISKVQKTYFKLGEIKARRRFSILLSVFERQFCYPNKPMNTFQYARELKEGINELIKEMEKKE
jgi:hypothetical protein